jgi:two-component system, chemotaxis family, CheB/CheR fusion protein
LPAHSVSERTEHAVANEPSPSPKLPAPETAASADQASGTPFPIVGVGASAGGLEAFTNLLQGLPPNPGLSFLYVQHLEPHHKSHLVEIFERVARIPVQEAQEGTTVEINNIYILPPNMSMAPTDGTLTLVPRAGGRLPHMPVDYLFRSLAHVQKNRAIGVILSGGGTDGTLGFQAIKAEGGTTFAQDEKTAKHEGMPRSAITDGCVDHVLPPPEIAQQLLRFVNHSFTREPDGPRRRRLPSPSMKSSNCSATAPRWTSATTSARRFAGASSAAWLSAALKISKSTFAS